jgi:hypothetical protein
MLAFRRSAGASAGKPRLTGMLKLYRNPFLTYPVGRQPKEGAAAAGESMSPGH